MTYKPISEFLSTKSAKIAMIVIGILIILSIIAIIVFNAANSGKETIPNIEPTVELLDFQSKNFNWSFKYNKNLGTIKSTYKESTGFNCNTEVVDFSNFELNLKVTVGSEECSVSDEWVKKVSEQNLITADKRNAKIDYYEADSNKLNAHLTLSFNDTKDPISLKDLKLEGQFDNYNLEKVKVELERIFTSMSIKEIDPYKGWENKKFSLKTEDSIYNKTRIDFTLKLPKGSTIKTTEGAFATATLKYKNIEINVIRPYEAYPQKFKNKGIIIKANQFKNELRRFSVNNRFEYSTSFQLSGKCGYTNEKAPCGTSIVQTQNNSANFQFICKSSATNVEICDQVIKSLNAKLVDETYSGWKTYTNAELGFTFKYPSQFKVKNIYYPNYQDPKKTLQGVAVTIAVKNRIDGSMIDMNIARFAIKDLKESLMTDEFGPIKFTENTIKIENKFYKLTLREGQQTNNDPYAFCGSLVHSYKEYYAEIEKKAYVSYYDFNERYFCIDETMETVTVTPKYEDLQYSQLIASSFKLL